MVHDGAPAAAESPDAGRSVSVLPFVLRTVATLVVGLPVAALLFVPGFFRGVIELRVAPLTQNLDAFWTPVTASLLAAVIAGAIVTSGDRIRAAERDCQVQAVWACVVLGIFLGIGLYVLLGWAMPLTLRAPVFPAGVSPSQALEVHPFLLTSPELFNVQRVFRGAGGFSTRVAVTLELRLWLALSMPAWATIGAVAMLAEYPRARLLRLLLVQVAAMAFLLVALFVAMGPGMFLRPPQLPMHLAWVVLFAVIGACLWWLRRRYRPEGPRGLVAFR